MLVGGPKEIAGYLLCILTIPFDTGSVPGTGALIFLSPLEASKPQQPYWPCLPQIQGYIYLYGHPAGCTGAETQTLVFMVVEEVLSTAGPCLQPQD